MADSAEQFCSSIVDHFRICLVREESVVVAQRHSGQRLVFFEGVLEEKPEGVPAGQLVAKIFDHHVDPEILAATAGAMKHAFDGGINCAMPVETRRGNLVARFHELVYAPSAVDQARNVLSGCALPEEQEHVQVPPGKKKLESRVHDENFCLVYVMTGLPGQPFSALFERTDYLRFCLGHQMGLLSKVLQGFHSDTIKRRRHEFYDLQNFLSLKKYATLCCDTSLRSSILQTFTDFERFVAPHMPVMTSGVRHGDTNLHNFLYNPNQDQRVHHSIRHSSLEEYKLHSLQDETVDPLQLFGIVDFDEVVHGPYIFDLACAVKHEIQISYLSRPHAAGSGVGVEAAIPMIAGFQKAFPLHDDEISVLYYAVCARMVQIYLGKHLAVQQYCGNHGNNTVQGNHGDSILQRYEATKKDTRQYMELFLAQDPHSVQKTWERYKTYHV